MEFRTFYDFKTLRIRKNRKFSVVDMGLILNSFESSFSYDDLINIVELTNRISFIWLGKVIHISNVC